MGESENGTKKLARVLGKKELFPIAIGTVIGSGIFSMLPVVLGTTGRSACLAFIAAAVITILSTAPTLFVSGTIRMRGGQYTYISIFGGKTLAGAFLIIHILTNISLSMCALAAAQYLHSAIPSLNVQITAIVILTIVFILNMMGVKEMAKAQAVLVGCLFIALFIFCVFGIPHVDFANFTKPEGFFAGGVLGFCSASALLNFAVGGAKTIMNLGAEAKNPTKDMPVVIIGTTLGVAVVYAIMAVVAGGILPISEVANQPLSVVAKTFLSGPLYVFFIVGGAIFALLTTLNGQLGYCTKPLLQGCVDGWFPESFGEISKKTKVPYKLLIFFYVVGLLPLIFNFDLDTIAATATFGSSMIDIMLAAFIFRLPHIIPKEWEASKWHIKKSWLYFWTIVGTVAAAFVSYMSIRTLKPVEIVVNLLVVAFALLYGYVVGKKGNVHMEISYEAQ